MRSSRVLLFVAALLLASAGILYGWNKVHENPQKEDISSTSPISTLTAPDDSPNISIDRIDSPAPSFSIREDNKSYGTTYHQPLPPEDIPFSEQVKTLSELAEAGHPTAACRLFSGSSRCRSLTSRRNFSHQLESVISNQEAQPNDEIFIRAIAQSQKIPGDDDCIGVDEAGAPFPDDYLPTAANNMSTRQKVLLAMMRSDGSLIRLPRGPSSEIRQGPNSEYVIPQFLADNTVNFLQEGFVHSDPLALEGLILIHSPGFLPGSSNGVSVALPDPMKFSYYALLMQHVYGPDALGLPVTDLLERTLERIPSENLSQLQKSVESSARKWNLNTKATPIQMGKSMVDDPDPLCSSD